MILDENLGSLLYDELARFRAHSGLAIAGAIHEESFLAQLREASRLDEAGTGPRRRRTANKESPPRRAPSRRRQFGGRSLPLGASGSRFQHHQRHRHHVVQKARTQMRPHRREIDRLT
jgi:hypothetical protein